MMVPGSQGFYDFLELALRLDALIQIVFGDLTSLDGGALFRFYSYLTGEVHIGTRALHMHTRADTKWRHIVT